MGYRIEWTSDHTLELAGVDQEKLDAVFSTRSNQIEAELAQQGLTRSEATAEQKQAVCLKTRKEKKQHHHPQDRVKQLEEWLSRARANGIELNLPTEDRRLEFERIYKNSNSEKSLENLISNAVSILTENSAAFLPHELLRECLRQSQGKYNPQMIQTEINSLCEAKVFEAEESLSRGLEEQELKQGSRGAESQSREIERTLLSREEQKLKQGSFSGAFQEQGNRRELEKDSVDLSKKTINKENNASLPPNLISTRDGRLTTIEALNREQKIIHLAKAGKDSQIPLSTREKAEAVSKSRSLNQGQTTALKQMVTSRDSVILIQGNAGVGKTYTMKALFELIEAEKSRGVLEQGSVGAEEQRGKGKEGQHQSASQTFTPAQELPSEAELLISPAPLHPCTPAPKIHTIRGLAPSAAAADVLQNESGITSQTLASYLLTPTEQLTPQEVILVDEASMISTRSAQQLLEKANELKSRVILIGDTKQLSAISAGAPFKLLQEAGLPTAVIDQNLRQRDPSLKQIVNSLATHDKNPDSVNEAYQKLNQSGKIQQIEADATRIKAISDDYLSRPVAVRQKTLILASTNGDKQAIASSVRRGLINEGTLGNENLKIQTLKRKNIDKFALTQAHHYQRGDVIKFQTDSAKFSKDLYYRVTSVDPESQTVTLIDTVGLTEKPRA